MKVLYVARLFSGLETSLRERRWQPSGVPTIFKMIEALSRQATPLRLLFGRKSGHGAWAPTHDMEYEVAGLAAQCRVLAGAEYFPVVFGSLRRWLAELRQIAITLLEVWLFRPDLIYIDHGNVWAAGILARCCSTPVVFRVMGVYPAMRDALTDQRFTAAILRWCYRGPYAAVICTQDGSGIEPWLDAALNPAVSRHALVNGVDLKSMADEAGDPGFSRPAGRVVIGFLGKLEYTKGSDEFVAGFLAAWTSNRQLHALIIGAGSRSAAMRQAIAAAGASDHATFIEHLPHRQVLQTLRMVDIYVSLNRFGNLSTANLEAMCLGLCMIFPQSRPDSGVDVVTDRLLPPETVVRIRSSEDVNGLTEALLRLSRDAGERRACAEATRLAAAAFIGDWSQRIDAELSILAGLLPDHGAGKETKNVA
jgi:glycosyltransferase involved in cell wall biosynthesis